MCATSKERPNLLSDDIEDAPIVDEFVPCSRLCHSVYTPFGLYRPKWLYGPQCLDVVHDRIDRPTKSNVDHLFSVHKLVHHQSSNFTVAYLGYLHYCGSQEDDSRLQRSVAVCLLRSVFTISQSPRRQDSRPYCLTADYLVISNCC